MQRILIGALISACFATNMYAAGRAEWSKVVIERSAAERGPASQAALAELGAEKLRDYQAFTVARVPSKRLTELPAQAKTLGLNIVSKDDWDKIFTAGAVIDTRETGFFPSQSVTDLQGNGLWLVQFIAPAPEEWINQVTARNLQYISYLPHNAAVVFGSAKAIADAALLSSVQWTAPYDYRLRPQPDLSGSGMSEFVVQFVSMPGSAASVARLTNLSETVIKDIRLGPYRNLAVRATFETVRGFAQDPFVMAIELRGEDLPSGEREAIGVTNVHPIWGSPVLPDHNGSIPHKHASEYRQWLVSRGVWDTSAYRIAFADQGLDSGGLRANGLGDCGPIHPDLQRSDIQWKDFVGSSTFCVGGQANPGRDNSAHGTAVIAMAVGNPPCAPPYDPSTCSPPAETRDSGTFFYGMGVAPKTGIIVQKISDPIYGAAGTSEVQWADDAIAKGATVQTHSHNAYFSQQGAYSTESQMYDQQVRDKRLPIFVSAGNICGGAANYVNGDCTQQVLSPATGKNVISVGGTESYRPDNLGSCPSRLPQDAYASTFKNVAYVSRRGTQDGRIKPEIVAPATRVSFANHSEHDYRKWCFNINDGNSTSYQYGIDSGTSFAAPQAAAAAVLIDKSRNAYFSPALLKAALVGSSVSIMGGTDDYTGLQLTARGVGTSQGFGRLNLDAALDPNVTKTYLDESSWTPFTGAGQLRSRTFQIADPSQKTVVVLAWSDVPAATGGGYFLTIVRDLDLEAVMNTCTTYVGNKLTVAEVSDPGSGCVKALPDYRNNVEMIIVPANSGVGSFTVNVRTTTWGSSNPGFGGGDQSFAVYAANAY